MGYASTDINGFDFIHMYVGNAKHSAQVFAALFGFKIVGYKGPETGCRDHVSYILNQNQLTFVVSAAIVPEHAMHNFVNKHGDGVHELSIRVKDPKEALDYAVAKGANTARDFSVSEDENGRFSSASIDIYGDTIITFINREEYKAFLPGYQAYEGPQFARNDVGLTHIDHIVGNVGEGEMNKWAAFFEQTMDLETYVHFDKGDISTQYSSLVSKVVRSKNSAVKFPINEPAAGLKKSQIEEYLEVNYDAGVQHIAIATDNLIQAISAMESNGVTFIETPDTYYEVIGDRAAGIHEAVEDLKKLNILIDRDEEGYLLQLFTQPLGDRPTLFLEFIQREGCEGFGQNNFQSLFESIEREQAKRGNL
ncbi:4-hydroxyphenylpyruvate dioxygenase [Acanthopleuribacter pedis]|uniref:4-hydroxyphenylpyruvate dioxygenase n=1 Tax=Acanthopleuribacter pedis TaxID=442870 RepID=A0A8J7U522_9BACT|nr:4-hydroxyphenylpyruvate dioxygenase [Acanthopleuribacter pedis]MBO1318876.1 4-hydroxyphenylpyruvate dioxygenase [Acanthopleuribacter pedis]